MAPRSKRNGKIDEEIEESFPASDPPAFMGGDALGAPRGRKTAPPSRRKKAKAAKSARKAKPPTKRRAKTSRAKKKKRATRKRTSR